MLQNEKYCGDALLQKTYVDNCMTKKTKKNNGERPKYLVKNHHEKIIDRWLFDKVQAEMARRSGKRKVSDKTLTEQSKYSSKYALTELLICGCCCTPYKRVTWSKKGKKKIVWRCISRLDHGTKYCKESPTIEEERLHTAVLKAINDLMSKRDQLVNIVKTNLAVTLSGQDSDDLNPLIIENRIRELESLTLELVDIIYKEKHAATYEDKLRAITEEIKTLKEKQEQYQAELNSRMTSLQMDDISRHKRTLL
jgi:hypothetical protein